MVHIIGCREERKWLLRQGEEATKRKRLELGHTIAVQSAEWREQKGNKIQIKAWDRRPRAELTSCRRTRGNSRCFWSSPWPAMTLAADSGSRQSELVGAGSIGG